MAVMHLDEEQLQRLLDGELDHAMASPLRDHLVKCAGCRALAAKAEREREELRGWLSSLDHEQPSMTADAVVARAHHGFTLGRRAAAILLLVGAAGAAYAAPGSPLPGWMRTALDRVGGRSESAAVAPDPSQNEAPAAAGIGVDPGAGLLILITANDPEGNVTVSLTDDSEIRVQALDGVAAFTSELDRLIVDNESSTASFEIEIPRDAPRVELQIAGERIFLKDGASVSAPSPHEDGRYVIPLAGDGRE